MIRFILPLFLSFFLISTQAFAGFEWVPPVSVPSVAPSQGALISVETSDMGTAFPAPAVSAEPLADRAPTQIISPQIAVPLPVTSSPIAKYKNISGKKLVIDPYPLRNNKPASGSNISISEVYKSMNEEAGKLNPVQLGNGMSTGAKKKKAPIPQAVRTASIAHKRFLTPTGMTPMMGAEPAPLPGMSTVRRSMPVVSALKGVYVEAIGFGRDLPLALALSQVVPDGFTHSFAKDVNAGANVSWEGGKPWNEVLNDMLRPQNMTAVIQDNQVIVQSMAKL